MKSNIKTEKDHILINISETGNDRDAILQNLNECKEGKCSCPTNEYEKLNKMDITFNEVNNDIIIELEPKKDESIAISEIENCLDYTASHLSVKDKKNENR